MQLKLSSSGGDSAIVGDLHAAGPLLQQLAASVSTYTYLRSSPLFLCLHP